MERLSSIMQIGPTNHIVLKRKADEWVKEMQHEKD